MLAPDDIGVGGIATPATGLARSRPAAPASRRPRAGRVAARRAGPAPRGPQPRRARPGRTSSAAMWMSWRSCSPACASARGGARARGPGSSRVPTGSPTPSGRCSARSPSALDEINRKLALPDALSWLPIALPVVALIVARLRLRPLSAPERRALVTPFLLVTSTYFTGIASGLGDAFDVGNFGPASAFALAIGSLGALVFYLMFVTRRARSPSARARRRPERFGSSCSSSARS